MAYGKVDIKPDRVRRCFNAGHMSVFEHASFTVIIEGISRACSHQLVRHRLASFTQQSQRYTRIDSGDDWYVIPPAFKEHHESEYFFDRSVNETRGSYVLALASGIKPEDARFLLPEATKTTLAMTMNVRELFHFLDLRTDHHAQWEIRELANKLKDELKQHDDQWAELIGLWESARKVDVMEDDGR